MAAIGCGRTHNEYETRANHRIFCSGAHHGQTRTFRDGQGITFPANTGGKRALTLNQIEFVGYGLNLDSGHNDYKGLDLKGKAVVWLGARGPQGRR